MKKVILGIGNPGAEYQGTRHNIGVDVVQALADHFKVSLYPQPVFAKIAQVPLGSDIILLVQPLTFVNLTGTCAAALITRYQISLCDLIVVVDDMDLPVGRLRLRPRGGSGGHKGVVSLIEHLGTTEFARLRIGIGKPGPHGAVSHVLSRFHQNERAIINRIVGLAQDALILWAEQGIESAMNRFNAVDERRDRI